MVFSSGNEGGPGFVFDKGQNGSNVSVILFYQYDLISDQSHITLTLDPSRGMSMGGDIEQLQLQSVGWS